MATNGLCPAVQLSPIAPIAEIAMKYYSRTDVGVLCFPHLLAWIVYAEIYHSNTVDFWLYPSYTIFPLINNTIFGVIMVQISRLLRKQMKQNNPEQRSLLLYAFVLALLSTSTIITSLVVKFLIHKINLNYLIALSWTGFAIAAITGMGILSLSGKLLEIASLFAANCIYLTSLYAYSFAVGLSCGENPICHWLHPEVSKTYVSVYPTPF